MEPDTTANRLGAYLQARRALVTPEQVGIPAGPRRRVSGLRREEVAMLAGISVDYYLRLERGRDTNPSAQVLDALARVLRLDEVEYRYLRDLAAPPRRRRTQPARRSEQVPDRLHHLLAAVGVPAFVEGRTFDVLASNSLAMALSPRLCPGRNRLRDLMLDPEEWAFHTDWEAATAEFVAAFRNSISTHDNDPAVLELLGELTLASGRFRAVWARHDVRRLTGNTTTVDHPLVGRLRLHRDKLPVEGVTLVLYYPDSHGDSADKFRLLGSLALESQRDMAPDHAVPPRSRTGPNG